MKMMLKLKREVIANLDTVKAGTSLKNEEQYLLGQHWTKEPLCPKIPPDPPPTKKKDKMGE